MTSHQVNDAGMQEAPEQQITSEKLRDYQKRAVRDVERAWKEHRSVLLVEFMGAGKTVEAAEIIRQHVARGERVLVLAHRGEILKQTRRKLIKAAIPAESIGFIWADGALNTDAPVQVASVMTLARRSAPENIELLVVDEAHHSQAKSWRKIFSWYPNAKVLGLTATPERLDGKPLREFFETMVLGEPCESLIEAGWITQPEIWTREDAWRPTGLRNKHGDYSSKNAAQAMSGSTIVGGIPAAYLKHAKGLPAVGFAATKEQATNLIVAFCSIGIASEALFDIHDEEQRETILKRLSSGKTSVIWTCDVISEGWDFPDARCVIMARPTASVTRYMQWAGRCMRPGNRSIILDHAGNYAVHGPPWEDREWSLDGHPEPTKRIAQVDTTGRVSFLEPIEVSGRLVRIDTARTDISRKQTVCVGLGMSVCPRNKKPPKSAFTLSAVRRRDYKPWQCHSCYMLSRTPEQKKEWARKMIATQGGSSKMAERIRKMIASRTPEQWRESARKALASQTPEQLSERARKAVAAQTPEQLSERARKARSMLTPEQRSEATRKAQAARTPEQRKESARKAIASQTPEQLSERARKARSMLTPEQRSEATRKAQAARTPEQRKESARKARAGMTFEQKSEATRKAQAARTPEQRSESARKAVMTRRANRPIK